MSNITIFILIIFMTFSAQADEKVVAEKFENIFMQYNSTKNDLSDSRVKLLIKLDRKLRSLVYGSWTRENKIPDRKILKEKYQTIGLNIGHYSDSLDYSGQLLKEAKLLDVNALNASYTSYADICDGADIYSEVCNMPNLLPALKYEKDFPQGPFIKDTMLILAYFYDDLFKALKIKDEKDYKYECFSQYMNDKPLTAQLDHTRKLSIKYYRKALSVTSNNHALKKSIREAKKAIESGNNVGWHFCGD